MADKLAVKPCCSCWISESWVGLLGCLFTAQTSPHRLERVVLDFRPGIFENLDEWNVALRLVYI
jgi:hypothetical protein